MTTLRASLFMLLTLSLAACGSTDADSDGSPLGAGDGPGGSGGGGGGEHQGGAGGEQVEDPSGGSGGTSQRHDDDCYSPTQNFTNVEDEGAYGCECDGEPDVCVGGAALMCDDGTWLAVEDGPCMPTQSGCALRLSVAHAQVSTAMETSDPSCEIDDDCVIAGQQTGCWDGCFGAAVSRSAKVEVDAVIDSIDANQCANFAEECPQEHLIADCMLPDDMAVCVEEKCRIRGR